LTASAILKELKRSGLLLKQDKHIPNVVSLVTDETLSGSWWAHPQAHTIFRVLEKIAADPDVAIAKLLAGKDTFVHRDLWPALAGVGTERAPWQMAGVMPAARKLFARIQRDGVVQSKGPVARELELRLLVYGTEVHTDRGHHEMRLESWEHWARRVGCRKTMASVEACLALERAATALGAAPKILPWRRRQIRKS
jgi:hypothetical protein